MKGIPNIEQQELFIAWLAAQMQQKIPVFTNKHQVIGFNLLVTSLQHLTSRYTEYSEKILRVKTLQECCQILQTVPGIGRFFAWQISCDLLEANQLRHRTCAFFTPPD
jgi:transposase